jgi:hypothetical protein
VLSGKARCFLGHLAYMVTRGAKIVMRHRVSKPAAKTVAVDQLCVCVGCVCQRQLTFQR